ncbi:MAG: hypothetical protein HKN04_03920 [Rhodothermaceae bacterium]|nr:hypothetical protein [Rhodothermaceae bacterium]
MFPFDLLPYWDRAALDRALPPRKGRDAFVELHNLIAAAESPHDFGPDDLRRIGRQHGVDLRTTFTGERRGLYAEYLDHCLGHENLTDEDRAMLAHLARALWLSADDLRVIHEQAFGRTVSSIIADDCLSLEERLLLYKLQHTLHLDPGEANEVYETMAREKLLVTVARALCDGELSTEEAEEIEALEARLDVRVPERVEVMLDRAARRWRLRHGALQPTDVFVRLLPGEFGYFSTPGWWRELNYARLRVLLGQYRDKIHRGETADLYIPEKAFLGRKPHDGHIEITNKRLALLRGNDEPVLYSLFSLVGVERYANGVRISVKGDRTFVLNAGSDTKTLYAVLYRALHPGRALPHGG